MSTPVLSRAPNFRDNKRPLRSFQLSSEAYFLSIAKLQGSYATSISAPVNSINLFDATTLREIGKLPGHNVAITSLHTVSGAGNLSGPVLISSGKDGSVKIWDTRSNSVAVQMNELKPILCCDISSNGSTIIAGTEFQGDDALLVYWDPRQPNTQLRKHSSTHSDDITTVSFAPSSSGVPSNIVLSGSADGLISLSNADDDDEDEAVGQVGNWGCSIAQVGWMDGAIYQGPKIWASSDMETFSTWSDELDQCQSQDIRSPALHGDQTWVTDYLISCSQTSLADQRLGIFVGSNEGDIALLSNDNLSTSGSPWTLHNTWSTKHVGVVRSLLLDEENNVLLTGGEDAKLHMWRASPGNSDDMDIDSPTSSRKRSLETEEHNGGKRTRH